MSDAAYIDHASKMARDLVQREVRGSGDTDNAMRRVEAKYGVPYAVLWKLRYRKPSDILVGVYLRLADAYEAQREAQIKRLAHEREITNVKGRLAEALVKASDALAREKDREEG